MLVDPTRPNDRQREHGCEKRDGCDPAKKSEEVFATHAKPMVPATSGCLTTFMNQCVATDS